MFDRFRQQPEDYDPHLHRQLPFPTKYDNCNFETLVHLMKGSFGTGILAMPQAFSRVGIISGCIATVVLGIIFTHCLHVLVKSQYEACKRKRVASLSYPETMLTHIMSGPKVLHPLARCLALSIDVILVVYQLGVCCIYISFMASNITKILDPHVQMAKWYSITMVMVPLLLLNLIPSLKAMAPFSAFADFIALISVAMMMYFMLTTKKSTAPISYWGTISGYPLFYGTTMFALTSVGVVLTTENNMKTPKAFVKPFGILNISMGLMVTLYVSFGAVGYLYCVSQCNSAIILDLPAGERATSVMILYMLPILVSYGLHCYVPVQIIWRGYIAPRLKSDITARRRRTYKCMLKIGLCLLTFVATLVLPHLGLFISLHGAFNLAGLSFIYPALMEVCIAYPDKYGPCYIHLLKDIMLMIIGTLGLIAGTSTAVYKIILSYKE